MFNAILKQVLKIRMDMFKKFTYLNRKNTEVCIFNDGVSIYIRLGYGQYTEQVKEIMAFLDKYEFFDHFSALMPHTEDSYGESSVTYVKNR